MAGVKSYSLGKSARPQLEEAREVRALDHDMLKLGALPPIRNAPRHEARQKLSGASDFTLPRFEYTKFQVFVCSAALRQHGEHAGLKSSIDGFWNPSNPSQTWLQLQVKVQKGLFLLRRTAVRAISATPSKAFLATPRSISTITPAFRTQQKWAVSAFQRRFASDDVVKKEVAAEAPEDFAQTVAEPITEDGLTPVQQDAQAEPTNAEETVGADALEAVAKQADKPTRKPFERREKRDTPPNNTLYVGNLYYEVTPDQLKRVFSRFGEVENVNIVYDNKGLSRGFAYVEFKNVEDAKTAIDNLDMQVFEGRNLVCQFHRPKPNSKTSSPSGGYASNPPAKTLFIGNMSFEMSDKDLNDLFRDIRNVMDVRVAIDRRTGQPRGFAHADFIDIPSATKAKGILAEKVIYGRQLRVDFSKSNNDRPKRNDSAQEGQ